MITNIACITAVLGMTCWIGFFLMIIARIIGKIHDQKYTIDVLREEIASLNKRIRTLDQFSRVILSTKPKTMYHVDPESVRDNNLPDIKIVCSNKD